MRDEGGPFEAVLQEKASNHLKRLWSKAMVVRVEEKAHKMCQVWTTKMSESEPRLRDCVKITFTFCAAYLPVFFEFDRRQLYNSIRDGSCAALC